MLVLVLWCVGSRLWSVVGVCGENSSGVDVGVVCGVAVVLVWCWCSGVGVGGAVVCGVVGGGDLSISNLTNPTFPWRGEIAAQILILLWWYFIC